MDGGTVGGGGGGVWQFSPSFLPCDPNLFKNFPAPVFYLISSIYRYLRLDIFTSLMSFPSLPLSPFPGVLSMSCLLAASAGFIDAMRHFISTFNDLLLLLLLLLELFGFGFGRRRGKWVLMDWGGRWGGER